MRMQGEGGNAHQIGVSCREKGRIQDHRRKAAGGKEIGSRGRGRKRTGLRGQNRKAVLAQEEGKSIRPVREMKGWKGSKAGLTGRGTVRTYSECLTCHGAPCMADQQVRKKG